MNKEQKKYKILIRADGNYNIGLGHLIRCSALAEILLNHFSVTFYCIEVPENICLDLEKKNIKCYKLNSENEFITKVDSNCIVVLDGYNFNTNYQKQIKALGSKLVCIDDLHDIEFVADLIINYTPGIEKQDYKTQNQPIWGLGLDYVLLRSVFFTQKDKIRKREKIENVLICFGGTDNKNITINALQVSLKFKEIKKVIVITGSLFKNNTAFSKLIRSDNRVDYRQALTDQQMHNAFLEADLAIIPASGVLFEAIASGCIIISGIYTKNQKYVYKNFLNEGIIYDANNFNEKSIKKAIIQSLENKRKQIIISDSKERIKNLFFLLIAELREASLRDKELFFNWANEPTVRKNSFNEKSIEWDNHNVWFDEKLNSKESKLFILELMGEPIGQIRFDKKNNYWLIDYSIDIRFRGKGFGKVILMKSLNHFNNTTLKAYVKQNNISSYQVFKSLEFSLIKEEIIHTDKYYVYEKIV